MFRVNGLFGHIQRNNWRSMVMFLGFAVAIQLIGLAALFLPLFFLDPVHSPLVAPSAYAERYGIAIFVLSGALFLYRYMTHAKALGRTVNFNFVAFERETRLHRIVEVVATGAGIAMPRLAIIETAALNAFACGLGQKSAVIVVTRGLLSELDDDELEAVIAHEVAHIVHGDIRTMAAANVMVSTLSLIREKSPFKLGKKRHFIMLVILPGLLFVFMIAGALGRLGMLLARLSRLLIASSREFVADAEAVRMTKNAAALGSALRRIEGRSKIPGLDPIVDAMMIDGAAEGADASHPAIAERLDVLRQHAGLGFDELVEELARTERTPPLPKVPDAATPAWSFGGGAGSERKSLLNRVKAGSDEDVFGFDARARKGLAVVRVVVVGIMMLGALSAYLTFNGIGANETDPANDPRLHSADPETRLDAETRRLSVLDPLEARCFGTQHYRVGDFERHDFQPPDMAVVEGYLASAILPGDIRAEKYAAIHLRSLKRVREARTGEALAKALDQYVDDRKQMLLVMHRFFGEEGLAWMREAYESEADQRVVARIAARRPATEPAGGARRGSGWGDLLGFKTINAVPSIGSKGYDRIPLLIESSSDFIPCRARAELNFAEREARAAEAAEAEARLLADFDMPLKGTLTDVAMRGSL